MAAGMFRSVIFDLESVPDLEAGRAFLGMPQANDMAIREALAQRYARPNQHSADVFIRLPMQKLVCLGALYIERNEPNGAWRLTGIGAGHVGQRTERDLISGFAES